MIPIYKPYLPSYSLKYAHEAIDSGWISSLGKYKKLCEEKLKEILNIKYVLLVNNGTAATHLVSKSLKHKYPHIKKIIAQDNVYVAAWNSFLYDGDFELQIKDIDENTWNLDRESIKEIEDNTAILIVHNLGNIFNVPLLKREHPNVIVVEDACESFLGSYEGKSAGTESLCSSLSFFANKSITCGEGGAFLTNDEEIFEYANLIHGQGQSKERYIHNHLGYNYRMTNIQAALLYGQLEIINEIQERKKWVIRKYVDHISTIPNVDYQYEEEYTIHSDWMFGIRIPNNPGYNQLNEFFLERGIETRPFFYPITSHGYLNMTQFTHNLKLSSLLSKECVLLPSYPELTEKEIYYICDTLKTYIEELRID